MTDPGRHEPYARPMRRSAPPSRSGPPGWAIAVIAGGSMLFLAVAVVTAATLGAIVWAVLAPPTAERILAPPVQVEPEPDPEPDPSTASAEADAAHIVDTYEAYLAALHDGSIYDRVPGGRSVDPAYVEAFIYVLTDHRSAVRFMSPGQNAQELAELAAATDALEERFLAGRDLEVDVEITRADGSVFRSDGEYRTLDEGAGENGADGAEAPSE